MENKPCCEEQVQLLVENESTPFTEDDREWLLMLEEDQIGKLMPGPEDEKVASEEGGEDEDKGEGGEDTPVSAAARKGHDDAVSAKPQTVEEFVATAPAEIAEVLNHAMATHKKLKDGLVSAILANKDQDFTKQELEAKPVAELQKLARLAGVEGAKDETVANFAGQGGGVHNTTGAGEVLETPEMQFGGTK